LSPPAVVSASFAAEVRSLHVVTVTAAQLSAELRTTKRAHLDDRIRAFTLAARPETSPRSARRSRRSRRITGVCAQSERRKLQCRLSFAGSVASFRSRYGHEPGTHKIIAHVTDSKGHKAKLGSGIVNVT
jgi:hypothetical protein